MKPFHFALFGLAFGAATLPAVVAAQTPPAPASGRVLIATCTGCHGQNGKSAGAIPTLAGQTEAQIRQAMLDYKNDRRPATIMSRHAKGFSDDEIGAIAREIAATWR
ncbi:MAG: c-type cytochrome [Telmatospirillum sp.]|nr:c-type cytochrome [Telmatospirillum sp.]